MNFVVAAILLVSSSSVWASKARLQALGQPVSGSHAVSDTRNVFMNPAEMNIKKDYVIFEWGSDGGTTPATMYPAGVSKADLEFAPKAEGGFLRSAGSFVYGAYFGAESNQAVYNRYLMDNVLLANAANSFLEEDNRIDVFFGGDAGVQWGVSASYSGNQDEQNQNFTKDQSAIGLKIGLVAGNIDWYGHYTLQDQSKGGQLEGDKYQDKGSLKTGAALAWHHFKFFGEFTRDSFKATHNGIDKSGSNTIYEAGITNVQELNDKAKFIITAGYQNSKIIAKVPNKSTMTGTGYPVSFALEADAASWVTLRGSVSQRMMSENKNFAGKKYSTANSTDVAAGSTIHFGNLKFDGVIGTDGNGANNENGTLKLDNLMTRVSMAYWF